LSFAVFDDSNNQIDILASPPAGNTTGNFVIINLKDGSTTKNSTLTFPDSNFTSINQAVFVDSTHVALFLESTNPAGAFIFGVADLTSGQITKVADCTGSCTNIVDITLRIGLSPGEIAAIVIAAVAFVGIAGIIGCIIRRRRLNAGAPAK